MLDADFLTIPEVAELLRINVDSAYRLAAQGRIPSIKLGEKSVRVPRAALLDHLSRQAGEALVKT